MLNQPKTRTDWGPIGANGVGHIGPTPVTVTHQHPNEEQQPTIGFVCLYPKLISTTYFNELFLEI